MSARPEDLAMTLRARRVAAFASDHERANRLRVRASEVSRVLRSEALIDAAWLVGSLAWGGFGTRSDVDFVVRGVPPDALGSLWLRLSDELASPVDVLRFEDLTAAMRDRVSDEGLRLDEP